MLAFRSTDHPNSRAYLDIYCCEFATHHRAILLGQALARIIIVNTILCGIDYFNRDMLR